MSNTRKYFGSPILPNPNFAFALGESRENSGKLGGYNGKISNTRKHFGEPNFTPFYPISILLLHGWKVGQNRAQFYDSLNKCCNKHCNRNTCHKAVPGHLNNNIIGQYWVLQPRGNLCRRINLPDITLFFPIPVLPFLGVKWGKMGLPTHPWFYSY